MSILQFAQIICSGQMWWLFWCQRAA